jgi:hypothetical protein
MVFAAIASGSVSAELLDFFSLRDRVQEEFRAGHIAGARETMPGT